MRAQVSPRLRSSPCGCCATSTSKVQHEALVNWRPSALPIHPVCNTHPVHAVILCLNLGMALWPALHVFSILLVGCSAWQPATMNLVVFPDGWAIHSWQLISVQP